MESLFHQDVIVAPLASGSRGNCTFVGDHRSGVLIDCGLSTRQVLGRLEAIGLGDARIEAVLITHEHSDHVGGARILDDRLFARHGARVPFYLSRGTALGLDQRCTPQRLEIVDSGKPFRVGPLVVEPFTIPHDTRDPLAYLVSRGSVTVGIVTDLGRSTRLVESQLARAQVAVLEFNHDLEMLLDGPYPWSLKQRVRGNHGHLSNAQSAEIVRVAATSRLEHLVLAHLSDDNNTPEKAHEAASAALYAAGLRQVRITVARQVAPVGPIEVSAVPEERTPPATKRSSSGPADGRAERPSPRSARSGAPELPPGFQLGLFRQGF